MATSKINVITLLDDISENLPIGTPVAALSLTDPVDGTVSYALVSANVTKSDEVLSLDNSFKIEGSKIVTTAQIDYEPMALLGLHIVIAAIAYVDGIEIDRKLVSFDISDVLEIHRGTSKFDQLTGTVGMDKMVAGAGNDMLLGYDGNDILHGGMGQDILTGGSGADIFLFKSIKESTVKAPDVITDWHHVVGDPVRDLIDLRTIDANTRTGGNQSFDWIATKSFTGHAGELRYEKLKSETFVYADVNGDRKADFAIHFDDAVKLYKADFLL